MNFIRLGPYLASRTALSRRQAEEAVRQGRLSMNGEVVSSYTLTLTGDLYLDGQKVCEPEERKVWIYHKPPREMVTHWDPQGRPTVFETVRDILRYEGPLVSVGRLDYRSQGLLVMTNTPKIAHTMETSRMPRVYDVEVQGLWNDKNIKEIEKGVCIDGIEFEPCQIRHKETRGEHHKFHITLTEGKKREIRILMEAIDLHVTFLCRLSFGPILLKGLPMGHVKELSPSYVDTLVSSPLSALSE